MKYKIDRLFGSRTRIVLLSKLFADPSQSFYISQLAEELSIPYSVIYKEINNLELLGIIKKKQIGHTTFITLDSNLPYFEELRGLIKKISKALNEKELSVDTIREIIVPTLKKNDVKKAAIFGSFATGSAGKGSDVDILVEFSKPKGLEFFGLKETLERKLKRKVDLLTFNSINPHIRERVLKEMVNIL